MAKRINDCIIRIVAQIEEQEYSCVSHIVSFFVWCELWMLLFTRYYPARRFGMNMPKSRDIQREFMRLA